MLNSSIGLIGMPYFDEKNDRTKAFYTTPLNREGEIKEVLDRFLVVARGTRLSVRLLARNIPDAILMEIVCSRAEVVLVCEAILPVNGSGLKIVYYGWNHDSRRTNLGRQSSENDLLGNVRSRQCPHFHDYSDFTVEFSVGREDWSQTDVSRLLEIYQRTFSGYLIDFTVETVRTMLETNWVSLIRCRERGEIVSVAMGELVEINAGGIVLSLSELSEVATHPDFQRRGLAHLAFSRLRDELVRAGVKVVFSETRAVSYGMMAVAHDAGFEVRGLLEQHCVISSPFSDSDQDGAYGDLVIFALPSRA
ncbi:MAG TPA: GNAT family N-acetyltransferase [Candidatus Magasanikbacteria bacterium]|nr:GNAT family N-acetyltransferase [Candidatus Magasanikbacteria bacterium]